MAVEISRNQIEKLVEEVVRRVRAQSAPPPVATAAPAPPAPARATTAGSLQGVYGAVDEAVAAAGENFERFRSVPLARRRVFVAAMRRAAEEHAEELARQAVEETGLGRAEHKVQKNLLAARKTPGVEDLAPQCHTGDDGLTLIEPAPFGVVGAITPCTNPAATIINNSLSLVAAGNAVVFNPHPAARAVTNRTVHLLNRAIEQAGGPPALICSLAEPSLDTSRAIMRHPGVRLLLVTGGGAVVQEAMSSGKRTIAAGPGNPPVIVDDTADISHAARCIVDGASFDNNILCTAEKEVFVYENVADRLLEQMLEQGAQLVEGAALERLVERVVQPGQPHPHPVRDFVGRDARVLAEVAGITAGERTRLLVCRVDFDHPLVQAEMLMPLLPIVGVRDLDQALELARRAEHGYKHSAMMHSENVSRMSRVAREIETTIFVKNAPSYAGLGFGGEGFATLSIAGPTGEGLTSARTFTRQRRCVLAGAFRIV
ncbi:MAG: aldehyde dehydrogenase EutE [Deltaproteobacteria bacterium]|nr:MAG: aldehyde dehydrogenase EutE [Deltaproteobacteria bacterium]